MTITVDKWRKELCYYYDNPNIADLRHIYTAQPPHPLV